MSTRLLIIEDELLIAAMTEDIVKSYGYEVAAIAQNSADAHHFVQNYDYDMAIVDINLGTGLEGLEVGRMLKSLQKPFLYLTSYESSDIIKKATETSPGTYLIKPFNPAQLLAALEVIMQNSRQKKPAVIRLQDGNAVHQLVLKDIKYVHADNIHIDIYTKHQRLTLRMSLKCFREQVPENTFIQPHRSYLLNIRFVTRVTATEIWLGEQALPIARTYKDMVLEKFGNQ